MDRFYYDLLNIDKKKTDEKEYTNILDKIIKEETDYIKIDNPTLDRVCKIVSTNINDRLKKEKIDSKIINTKNIYDMYEHEFVLSSFIDLDNNVTYYLIDPTYSQFMDKGEYSFEAIYPPDILKKEENGKILLNNLLDYGYSKVNDNDIKRYIGSLLYEEDINKIDVNISDLILERSKR